MNQFTDKKHIPEVISEDRIHSHLNRIFSKIKNACEKYKRGYIAKDEMHMAISKLLDDGFYKFLDMNESNIDYPVRIPIRRDITPESWERLLEDYEMWKAGKQPQSMKGRRYLYYGTTDSERGIQYGDEASTYDKMHFFQLMDAFLISPALFEPLPEKCPKPKFRDFPSGVAEHYSSVTFDCADDAGLLTDGSAAIGKKYTLTDKNGLIAELEIQGILAENRRVGKPDIGFKAVGTIEGYTSPRKREIEVASYKSLQGIFLTTLISKDDNIAFSEYPLWSEYREYVCKENKIYLNTLNSIIEKYSN